MDTQRTGYLLQQYQSGKITHPEWEELAALLTDDANNEDMKTVLQLAMEQHHTGPAFLERDYRDLINRITAIDRPLPSAAPVRRIGMMRRWGSAAAIILLLCLSGIAYRLFIAPAKTPAPVQAVTLKDVAPGTQGAILTLADGRQVVLDSLNNGLIAKQGSTDVTLKDGTVRYDKTSAGTALVAYNTMTTPRGRQYQLVLPDGSRVWLNAASSIRYPVAFNNNERRVEISGEAYFEIAHNTRMPFRVKLNNYSTVEVLGTHFNVNTYTDEPTINTTLLEGTVRFHASNNTVLLKPGQQASASDRSPGHPINLINDVDIEQVMAWKNGLFSFDNATIQTVMRQLSRWYDIDVAYEGNMPDQRFFGQMNRDLSLLQVLKGLQVTKVNVRLEGKKLIIKP